jgi:hypothetical protein
MKKNLINIGEEYAARRRGSWSRTWRHEAPGWFVKLLDKDTGEELPLERDNGHTREGSYWDEEVGGWFFESRDIKATWPDHLEKLAKLQTEEERNEKAREERAARKRDLERRLEAVGVPLTFGGGGGLSMTEEQAVELLERLEKEDPPGLEILDEMAEAEDAVKAAAVARQDGAKGPATA